MTSSLRRVLLVSGPPASGKTTLARPLAERLGFALLAKDDIKEALFTAMAGPAGDVGYSRRIGDAAMELLWALAPRCPQVVLEANFRTKSSYERAKLAGLESRIVEVYCRLPLEEASRRFAERASRPGHHPAHALRAMSPERLSEYEEPFGLGPVIEVNTLRPVDLEALLLRIRAAWRDPGHPTSGI